MPEQAAAVAREEVCWRVRYREKWCPFSVVLGCVDGPDEATARVRAWRLWPDHSPVRLRVERADG
jgi:hypothetical protein